LTAWQKTDIGRCLLMVGDFATDGDVGYTPKKSVSIPFEFPGFALNSLSVRAFNWLYYGKVRERVSQSQVDIDSFFTPWMPCITGIGFMARGDSPSISSFYPRSRVSKGLRRYWQRLQIQAKVLFGSTQVVWTCKWKLPLISPGRLQPGPRFKIEPGLFDLLDQLDEIVVQHGGRIYLTKDVRVSKRIFEQGYPLLNKFRAVRERYKLSQTFQSLQSQRLAI